MILAAASYADGEGSPPEELLQAWKAKSWGLPKAGGTEDQPAGLLERMAAALNAYTAMESFNAANNKARWAAMNPGLDRLLGNILAMKMKQDGS
jgi:hypothetical protein